MKDLAPLRFTDMGDAAAYARHNLNGNQQLVAEIVVGGVILIAMLTAVGVGYHWAKSRRERGAEGVPTPEDSRFDRAKDILFKRAILKDHPVQRMVQEHLLSFLADDEMVKACDCLEKKKPGDLPVNFFDSEDDALAFLTDAKEGLGITVTEGTFRASWKRGLPSDEEGKDEKDVAEKVGEAMDKMSKQIGDLVAKFPTPTPAPAPTNP